MPVQTRPILRYHGGKFRLAPLIIPYFPQHEVYIEPFGGAFSVGLAKEPARIQVYNDLCHETVDLMRILRDPVDRMRLIEAVALTPFSREEHRRAWEITDDPIERARRYIVRSFQSIGAKNAREKNGWRTRTAKAVWSPCRAWNGWPEEIITVVDALRDVIIECKPWQEIFRIYDAEGALWFVDPPYLPATRSSGYRRTYTHELTSEDHIELLDAVQKLKGFVVLSGYPDQIYDDALAGWETVDFAARAQTNSPRVERIWINPSASAARRNLFTGAAS